MRRASSTTSRTSSPLPISRCWRRDLAGVDLVGADLRGVDLAGPMDLAGSNCMHIDETFAASPTGWVVKGAAGYDTVNHRMQITPPSNNSAGTAFYTTAINAPPSTCSSSTTSATARRRARRHAFVIAQAASADQLGPAVGASGTLGYQGMTGYAVEFDTYQNGSDPSGNHIAWMQASTGTHLLVGEPAFTLACGCERQADIRFTGTNLTVTVDGPRWSTVRSPTQPGPTTSASAARPASSTIATPSVTST